MKQIGFIIVCLLFFTGFYFYKHYNVSVSPKPQIQSATISPRPTISPARVIVAKNEIHSLFVPYWTMEKEKISANEYNIVIYFGITPNQNGINQEEAGYKNIPQFLKLSEGVKTKLLAVRMVDSAINSKILESEEWQKNIAASASATAKEFDFTGVVLDFEISSLSFDSVVKKITALHSYFATTARQNNLTFYTTLYGDVFYRLRPYDVKALSTLSDGIFIMAYDFHKARENPGPNFPLKGKELYGYDLQSMINDFLKNVPKEKIIVVLGMFGYDWVVDADNKATASAQSISLNEAGKKYVNNCLLANCQVRRDQVSAETSVQYVDVKGQRHAVWFEDMESVLQKQNFLKTKGINSFGLWAYSYF